MRENHFPRLYDAQYLSFQEDLRYWKHLAEMANGSILELGCGTGRVFLPLARIGYKITGIDNDQAMLARLSTHLNDEPLPGALIQQADIRAFDLQRKFGLIIVPCNTFANLDDTDLNKALACVERHLEEGGVFALDLPNPFETWAFEENELNEPLAVFEDLESGNPVQVFADQEQVEQREFAVEWHYDELLPDGKVDRTDVSIRYHLRDPKMMRSVLSQFNLVDVHFYGDYDFTAFESGSPRMLLCAKAGPPDAH
jgi:SAM-dependent methyltransferase